MAWDVGALVETPLCIGSLHMGLAAQEGAQGSSGDRWGPLLEGVGRCCSRCDSYTSQWAKAALEFLTLKTQRAALMEAQKAHVGNPIAESSIEPFLFFEVCSTGQRLGLQHSAQNAHCFPVLLQTTLSPMVYTNLAVLSLVAMLLLFAN